MLGLNSWPQPELSGLISGACLALWVVLALLKGYCYTFFCAKCCTFPLLQSPLDGDQSSLMEDGEGEQQGQVQGQGGGRGSTAAAQAASLEVGDDEVRPDGAVRRRTCARTV